MAAMKTYTRAEVEKHQKEGDLWTVVRARRIGRDGLGTMRC